MQQIRNNSQQIETFWLKTFLAWNYLFTPILGGLGRIFPNDITNRPNPTRKHVVWAIKRENRSSGTTCVRDREKRMGQSKKWQRCYISPSWGKPHWSDLTRNLRDGCRHACKVTAWNFQWLQFHRRSNFRFSYWLLREPYNSTIALPVIQNLFDKGYQTFWSTYEADGSACAASLLLAHF